MTSNIESRRIAIKWKFLINLEIKCIKKKRGSNNDKNIFEQMEKEISALIVIKNNYLLRNNYTVVLLCFDIFV
jgi:hypothetical protein